MCGELHEHNVHLHRRRHRLGLTGTVVLQDNGGDDLTVTANGSFTFATRWPRGGSYAVTVKPSRPARPARWPAAPARSSGANVTNVAGDLRGRGRRRQRHTPGADTFNRADGPLGPDWTDIADGGLAITSRAAWPALRPPW